jgi:hypothetical protein
VAAAYGAADPASAWARAARSGYGAQVNSVIHEARELRLAPDQLAQILEALGRGSRATAEQLTRASAGASLTGEQAAAFVQAAEPLARWIRRQEVPAQPARLGQPASAASSGRSQ